VTASNRVILVVLLLFVSGTLVTQPKPVDPVLSSMRQEVDRSMRNFKNAQPPPYFLSYQITDNRAVNVSASFGTLISSSDQTTRVLDVDIRVGDFKLDSTHPLREETESSTEQLTDRLEAPKVPLEDDPLGPAVGSLASDRAALSRRCAEVSASAGQRPSQGRTGRSVLRFFA
jgi:hypothetical protein